MDKDAKNSKLVEAALLDKALGGDLRAQMYWLNNRRADRWAANPERAAPCPGTVNIVLDTEGEKTDSGGGD